LATMSWASVPSLELIYATVLAQGFVNAIDNPLRRTFVRDLVQDDALANAVGLNSTVGTVTRTVGPAIGGLLIATLGVQWCFTLNVLSYVAVLAALQGINRSSLRQVLPVGRAKGQVTEGIRYAWGARNVRIGLLVILIVSVFAWNWSVILPVYAEESFAGDASMFGAMLATVGVGSFLGAIATARAISISDRRVYIACVTLGVSMALGAVTGMLLVAIAALVVMGCTSTMVIVSTQARLQLDVGDEMNSRVMALFSVAFAGSKPIGGLLNGGMIDLVGVRLTLAWSGAAVGALGVWLWIRSRTSGAEPSPYQGPVELGVVGQEQ